jgi:SnoaL-like protein
MDVVRRFNEAFNRNDVDALMALMTDDCVFENTRPAPDGERFQGQSRVRGFWKQFFGRSPPRQFHDRGNHGCGRSLRRALGILVDARGEAGSCPGVWMLFWSAAVEWPRSCPT